MENVTMLNGDSLSMSVVVETQASCTVDMRELKRRVYEVMWRYIDEVGGGPTLSPSRNERPTSVQHQLVVRSGRLIGGEV